MIDLTTKYLGMNLASPLVASASPLSDSLDKIRSLEDHRIAAVVLPSLFEEQLSVEGAAVGADLARGADSFPEASSFLPDLADYNLGPDEYLDLIRRAKSSVRVPIIASLNGTSRGGWLRYAAEMQQAGADAIELNIYSLVMDVHRFSADVEREYFELVRAVTHKVRIPVAVKISPFFTSIPNVVMQLEAAGAGAIVLFNRFYQPDIDINALEVVPSLNLSTPSELLLRLHWVAVIFGHINGDLAVTGGVHSAQDVLKSVMVGARVAMMTSALLRNGLEHLDLVYRELCQWMEEHEYESIQQMWGSMSQLNSPNPTAFERANYMRILSSYTLNAPNFRGAI